MRAQYAGLLTAKYRALSQQDLSDPKTVLDNYLFRAIFPKIGFATTRGYAHASIKVPLLEGAKERLQELGYTISESDSVDQITHQRVIETFIYWASHIPKP